MVTTTESLCLKTARPLARITTRAVGMQYRTAELAPGETLTLKRERGNRHDRNAIAVRNAAGETAGYIPRRTARWLAPLWDAGEISLEASAPRDAEPIYSADGKWMPLSLGLALCEAGEWIFRPNDAPASAAEALHETVRAAYEAARRSGEAEMIFEIGEHLARLARGRLKPETVLILALFRPLAESRRRQARRVREAVAAVA